ncbi:CLUMA_CG004654, isoform A [Clunio marinus]|uniref:CLUMA_CG004654, isoform A n=1 Tax=Clunio marinus TaxID=568069 RepID=A0A1J1HUC0_9DIPT|nr:CLUMA_CG004654, isoform A [Clunio marinus]
MKLSYSIWSFVVAFFLDFSCYWHNVATRQTGCRFIKLIRERTSSQLKTINAIVNRVNHDLRSK